MKIKYVSAIVLIHDDSAMHVTTTRLGCAHAWVLQCWAMFRPEHLFCVSYQCSYVPEQGKRACSAVAPQIAKCPAMCRDTFFSSGWRAALPPNRLRDTSLCQTHCNWHACGASGDTPRSYVKGGGRSSATVRNCREISGLSPSCSASAVIAWITERRN